jgi:hypothetical protein
MWNLSTPFEHAGPALLVVGVVLILGAIAMKAIGK